MRSAYHDHLNRSYIQSWNVTYERRLPAHFSLATSYVGTLTKDQMGFFNINAAGAGPGQAGQTPFQTGGRRGLAPLPLASLSRTYTTLQLGPHTTRQHRRLRQRVCTP